MTVTLYNYAGKDIVANKTLPTSGTDIKVISADYGFEGDQDVSKVSIVIESATKPTYNYCYIDSFSRYYFVTAKIWLSGNLWRLVLRCDVLKTFYTGILTQQGTVLYSGLGNAKYYDPRLIYNKEPTQTKTVLSGSANTGDPVYIVIAMRYMWPYASYDPPKSNQMEYYVMNPSGFYEFTKYLLTLSEHLFAALSNAIVSVSVVRWLDMTMFNLPGYRRASINFSTPEIQKLNNNQMLEWSVPTPTTNEIYQIESDIYNAKRNIVFLDLCNTYADRKAQRLIDIPYVGQINIDLDNMGYGIPAASFYIGCQISYDLGGNEYVVTPGYGTLSAGTINQFNLCDTVTFSNKYQCSFLTKESYSGETETRIAQILSLIGTAAAGIVTGIATEGATVPATVASLGMGVANMALTEQKTQYAKAASLGMSGTSNGGSMYDALKTTTDYGVGYRTITPVYATFYKKTNNSSTNPATFQADYGKPDGEYRTLSALVGTGFLQMGTITPAGLSDATESERQEIKNLLMTGIIL